MNEDSKQCKRKPGKPVNHAPVILLETGEVFDTFTEAAKAIGGSRQGVRRVANGTQSHHKGRHFVYLVK